MSPNSETTAPVAADALLGKVDRWRSTADLDSRAGAPVGNALHDACNEVERLRAERDCLQITNRALNAAAIEALERAEQAEAELARLQARLAEEVAVSGLLARRAEASEGEHGVTREREAELRRKLERLRQLLESTRTELAVANGYRDERVALNAELITTRADRDALALRLLRMADAWTELATSGAIRVDVAAEAIRTAVESTLHPAVPVALDPERVGRALRYVIADLDYDLHKEIEHNEDGYVKQFMKAYKEEGGNDA
jgi:hypothetical protein